MAAVQKKRSVGGVLINYDREVSTDMYEEWATKTLKGTLIDHLAIQYFGKGNLEGKTIVDFGCGTGDFLEKCRERGASLGLGIDSHEAIMHSGGHQPITEAEFDQKRKNHFKGELCFLVKDCFQPFEDHYGHFDFATAQFIIHYCKTEAELQALLHNVFGILKGGGKFYIGQNPYVANSKRDQDVIADLCGYSQPLRSDATGQDPFYSVEPVYRPGPTESGRPFTREKMFNFPCYFWSKEKVMEGLKRAGFINIQLLPSVLTECFCHNVPANERELLASLEEPFVLVGAQKP